MNYLLTIWFACGSYNALAYIAQWFVDGRPLHAEGECGTDRWYFVQGLLSDIFWSLLLGPVMFYIRGSIGMPIFPRLVKKEQK